MQTANVACPGVGGNQDGGSRDVSRQYAMASGRQNYDAMKNGESGFTLIELVVTIVVLGIIAVVIMPRFAGSDAFKSRGFYDQATATVRYAQKLAIARRRSASPIVVSVTSSDISVCCNNADGTGGAVIDPTTGQALSITAPAGVTLSSTSFTFDGLGRPSAAQSITFSSTIPGDPARSIVVEAETGYVHPGP